MSIPGSASPLFIGAAAAEEAAFQIDRSLRFNDGDSAYLNRTPSSAGNRRTWTWSGWVKRGELGNYVCLFGNEDYDAIQFRGTTKSELDIFFDGTNDGRLITSRSFRDVSAWYHIVVSCDTTQATASDRLKLYVNGVQETSFDSSTYPAQNYQTSFNATTPQFVGATKNTSIFRYFDGYLADVHFIDGQALAASDFGEYDDNNVWQPKEFTGIHGPSIDQSETWSSSTFFDDNGHSYYNSGGTITDLFDNVLGSSGSNGEWPLPVDGGTFELNFTQFSSATTVTFDLAGTGNALKINDSFVTIPGSGSETTATFNVSGLTKIEWLYNGGSNYCYLGSISVDGVLLVDDTVTVPNNSFYLKFADNSSNAALGTDSSGNSNTWTVNNMTAAVVPVDVGGDPTVSSSDKPFTTGFSVAFDGNDKMRMEGPGTVSGDFTWECFVKFTGTPDGRFFSAEESVNGTEYSLMRFYNGNLNVYAGDNNGYEANTYTGSVSADTWHHIAMVRSGSTLSHYLDGSRWGTNSYSGSFPITTLVLAHGYSGEYFTGSVSNARFVNGQALYTGTSYTVPTATLTTTSQSATASNVATLVAHKASLTANDGTKVEILNSSSDIDSLLDTPTNYEADSGNNGGNYCTLNPLQSATTLSNGNLDSAGGSGWSGTAGTFGMSSGKWYFEYDNVVSNEHIIGIVPSTTYTLNTLTAYAYGSETGGKYDPVGGSNQSYGSSWTTGDVIGVAFDADNGNLYFYKNGTVQNSGTAAFTGLTSGPYLPSIVQNGSSRSASLNFGQRPFAYTPPTGYVSLCTQNLADPTIADGSTAMDAKLWTSTTAAQTISGYRFSPDFLWSKARSGTYAWGLWDTVRGATKLLISNGTGDEKTDSVGLTAFTSDGFTAGTDGGYGTVNYQSGNTYVGFAWDAGSSTVSNTDGSITSSVRANQTAGFSICTYTSPNSSSDQSFGHSLNAKPDFVIVKNRDSTYNWDIYHSSLGYNSSLIFTTAATRSGAFSAEPTSSVINTKTSYTHNGTDNYLALCWTAVAGYSAFGSYEGNGNADGPFVALSFQPALIIIKNIDNYGSGYDWFIFDTTRDTFNVAENTLKANLNAAEADSDSLDILSNGFKIRTTANGLNLNAHTHVWAAFARHPFKTARAR